MVELLIRALCWVGVALVFALGEHIISGSEPGGEEAFAKLQELGVKTVLSVDGKVPDAELAAKYGMSYVHVPIQYKGIPTDQLTRIAKTFREKAGPFYVHCFHGMHRGPAASEVGRLVLDGLPRENAIAEMRQWCGVSEKYVGLYHVVAAGEMPSIEQTEALDWDFPNAHPFEGFRSGMVEMTRVNDNVKYLSRHGWRPTESHPDLDAVNEAAKLAGHLEQCAQLEEVATQPEDFRRWMRESVDGSNQLREALERVARGEDDATAANAAFEAVQNACLDCHAAYRN